MFIQCKDGFQMSVVHIEECVWTYSDEDSVEIGNVEEGTNLLDVNSPGGIKSVQGYVKKSALEKLIKSHGGIDKIVQVRISITEKMKEEFSEFILDTIKNNRSKVIVDPTNNYIDFKYDIGSEFIGKAKEIIASNINIDDYTLRKGGNIEDLIDLAAGNLYGLYNQGYLRKFIFKDYIRIMGE